MRRADQPKVSNLSRTFGQVEENLMSSIRNLRMDPRKNNYLMCRLDPFNAPSSQGIPDGNYLPKIVIDHRMSCTVTVGASGAFSVVLFPGLPHYMLFKASGATTGFALSTGIAIPTISTYASNGFWVSMNTPREYANFQAQTGSGIVEANVPYQAASFRMVSLAMRATYTGTPISASGTVTVYRDTAKSEVGRRLNGLQVECANSVVMSANDAYMTEVDIPAPIAALTQGTLVQRVDVPLLVRAKRRPELTHTTVPATKTFFVDSTQTSTPAWASNVCTPATAPNAAGFLGMDRNWDPVVVQYEGLAANSTVRFEGLACVEYVPGQSSESYKLAKPSEGQKESVDKTESQLSRTPVGESDKTDKGR